MDRFSAAFLDDLISRDSSSTREPPARQRPSSQHSHHKRRSDGQTRLAISLDPPAPPPFLVIPCTAPTQTHSQAVARHRLAAAQTSVDSRCRLELSRRATSRSDPVPQDQPRDRLLLGRTMRSTPQSVPNACVRSEGESWTNCSREHRDDMPQAVIALRSESCRSPSSPCVAISSSSGSRVEHSPR